VLQTVDVEEASVTIKVIVEFQAKPGARAELAGVLHGISATHGPSIPGFRGSIVHEGVDSPDALVEIAEWDSAEVQAAGVAQAMASGWYAPVMELVAAPLRVTRITQLNVPG
jgi:quinol monooxygenase YgiN